MSDTAVEDVVTISKDDLRQLRQTFRDVEKQYRKDNGEYWMGKKDGLRTALALLDPSGGWQEFNDSSPGKQATDTEKYIGIIQSAKDNIEELLYVITNKEKLHPQSRLNVRRWLEGYLYNVAQGLLPKRDNE